MVRFRIPFLRALAADKTCHNRLTQIANFLTPIGHPIHVQRLRSFETDR
jgi:hypothetical protein